MADFKKAWLKTSKNEGGYVNNSKDKGLETYRGITIASNPKWEGWDIVHKTIAGLGITNTLDAPATIRKRIDDMLGKIPSMDELVSTFYKKNYWDPLKLDAEPDQLIAEQVFDTAVNMGVGTAGKFINEARNEENA